MAMNGNFLHIKAYWKLFRGPNLMMMALTLILCRYAIFLPVYMESGLKQAMPGTDFLILIYATLAIAAGGYIVNDILDISIDELNKPGQSLIGNSISEARAWNIYYLLNITGILAGTYISWHAGHLQLGILFLIIATALYYYSLKYKYLPFWGNFTISILSALVILTYFLLDFFYLRSEPYTFAEMIPYFPRLQLLIFAYSFFAFITTFIREMVKDTQDMEGDRQQGCRTIPVLIGIKKVRSILIILLILTMISLGIMQYIAYSSNYIWISVYLLSVQALLGYSAYSLSKTKLPYDFAMISSLVKLTMMAGILSMVFTSISS